ncbi:MAG: hypothetical protein WDW36_001875 [Sanguina aurantia]
MTSQSHSTNYSQQEPLLRSIEDAEYETGIDGAPAGSPEDNIWTNSAAAGRPKGGLPIQDSFTPVPSTFWPTSMTMTKAILGAGMMVIPKAFQMLGAVLCSLFLILVAGLTWFTISGLVYAAEKTGKRTFAAVVRTCCGKPAKWGLLVAMCANCFGLCVVYVVILGDCLLGEAPEFAGLIRQIRPSLDPAVWYMGRKPVLAATTAGLLAPLALFANLNGRGMGVVNAVGVVSVVLLAAAMVVLAVAAHLQGLAYQIPLFPDWELLRGPGHTTLAGVLSIIAVLPILLNADICHQAVFPAMTILQPYSRRGMNAVVAVALATCNTLYLCIALSTVAAFGPALADDVLNNLDVGDMAQLVGPFPAHAIALVVRMGYFTSLVGSFLLMLYPLRQAVLEMVLRSRYHKMADPDAHWVSRPVTLLLVCCVYGVAVFVPSLWLLLSLVGSAAATMMGFIFPSLVILVMARKPRWTHTVKRCTAVVVAIIGGFLFINGFAVFLVKL